jgi:hypothetical protein
VAFIGAIALLEGHEHGGHEHAHEQCHEH